MIRNDSVSVGLCSIAIHVSWTQQPGVILKQFINITKGQVIILMYLHKVNSQLMSQ